jgi:hypothetical protein
VFGSFEGDPKVDLITTPLAMATDPPKRKRKWDQAPSGEIQKAPEPVKSIDLVDATKLGITTLTKVHPPYNRYTLFLTKPKKSLPKSPSSPANRKWSLSRTLI